MANTLRLCLSVILISCSLICRAEEKLAFTGFTGDPFAAKLIHFNAAGNVSNQAIIEWETDEQNTFSYFELERQQNDGIFESIALIFGKNTHSSKYIFKDNSTAKGINTYRLKMVDINQLEKFSKTLVVKIAQTKPSISLFPALTSHAIMINGLAAAQVIHIYDSYGKLVRTEIASGANHVSGVSNLKKGLYNIFITDEKQAVFSGQFMKL